MSARKQNISLLLPVSCLQNPRERITLGRVMRHDWVTKRGAWPLATMRELSGCAAAAGGGDETPRGAANAAAAEDCLLTNPAALQLPDLLSTMNVLDVPREVRGLFWHPLTAVLGAEFVHRLSHMSKLQITSFAMTNNAPGPHVAGTVGGGK
jgi:hypothetical protein